MHRLIIESNSYRFTVMTEVHMSQQFIATASIEVKADANSVWKALTDPELIKQYLFGTETECDWKVGSPIFFRGEWQGKKYEDKGKILEVEPGKRLSYKYWSSMSGMPDVPENYAVVTFELSSKGNTTVLRVVQDGSKSEESKKHSEQNWGLVLDGLKKLLEAK